MSKKEHQKNKKKQAEDDSRKETYTPQSSTDSNVNQSFGDVEFPYEFGRYRIDYMLGEGAMGAVYLAEDTQLKRKVALKTPRFEGEDEDLLERFYREARSAAGLNHANICQVYDVGEHLGTHFISMEYIEGRPLSDFINPEKLQSEKQIAILIRKLALALQEAHQKSVIHRDLKPANIMVNKKNEPIVMDFGLAVQVDQDVRTTQSGLMIGSPAYMSPEQVEGERDKVGPASDVYSLGVVLYELMTGVLPFNGSIGSVMSQILNRQPVSPCEHRPDLDERLADICLLMLVKPVDERINSMEEVVDVLSKFLKGDSQPVASFLPEPAAEESSASPAEQIKSLQKKINQFCKEHHFTEAIRLLEQTVKKKQSAEFVTWAKKEHPRVKAEQKRVQQEMAATVRVAKQMVKVHDYSQASRILQQVPVHARTTEMEDLLNETIDLQSELDALIADVDMAIHRDNFDNMKPTVKRLLELQPSNKKALKILEEEFTYGLGGKINLKSKTETTSQGPDNSWIWKTILMVGIPVFLLTVGTMVFYTKIAKVEVAFEFDQSIVNAGDVEIKIDGQKIDIKQARQKIDLSTGTHKLVIMQGGKVISSENFVVNKRDIAPIRIALNKVNTNNYPNSNNLLTPDKPDKEEQPEPLWQVSTSFARTPLPDGSPGEVMQLLGHRSSIYGIAMSPNGKSIATASGGFGGGNDKTLRLWDIASKKELGQQRIQNISSSNTYITFTPDGQQIFGAQDQLNLWNTSTLKHSDTFDTHENVLTSAACSSDGLWAATSARNGSVIIWKVTQSDQDKHIAEAVRININTGTTIPTSSYVPIGLAFLPDNKRILISSVHWEGTKLYNVESGKVIRRYMTASNKPVINEDNKIELSSDGKYFAAIQGGTVYLVNVETGHIKNKITPSGNQIRRVSFLPNGKHLLTTGDESKFYISNCKTGKVVYQYNIGQHARYSCVTPDGRFVVTACNMYYDTAQKKNLTDGKNLIRVIRLPKEYWPPQPTGGAIPAQPGIVNRTPLPDGPPGEVTQMKGHRDYLTSLIFSPDGRTVASSGFVKDNSFRVWDVTTGKEIHNNRSTYAVSDMTLSSDGKHLLVGYHAGRILLYEYPSLTEVGKFTGHTSSIRTVTFSPDGKRIASVSSDKTVRIWDVATRKQIKVFPTGEFRIFAAVAFTPDGKRLLLSTAEIDFGTKLLDIETGETLRQYKNNGTKENLINFSKRLSLSPNGKSFLTIKKPLLSQTDIETGRTLQTFGSYSGRIEVANFLPDGRHIIAGNQDQTLYIWNIKTGKIVHQFTAQNHSTGFTAASPDGRFVITGNGRYIEQGKALLDSEVTLRLWRLPNLNTVTPSQPPTKPVVIPTSITRVFTGAKSAVRAVRFSQDGKQIFFGGNDNVIYRGSLSNGRSTSAHNYRSIYSMDISKDGLKMAMAARSKGVRIFNRGSGKTIDLKGVTQSVVSVVFHPNNRQLATYSVDGSVRVWNISRKTVKQRKRFSVTAIKGGAGILRYSANGRKLIVVPQSNQSLISGKFYVFDAVKGIKLLEIKLSNDMHTAGTGLAVSPDSPRFVVGTYSSHAIVYDMDTGKSLGELHGHKGGVFSLAWSDDGRHIATGDQIGDVRVWDAKTFQLLVTYKGHQTVVTDLDFSPDSKFLASSSGRRTANLKNTPDDNRVFVRELKNIRREESSLELVWENLKAHSDIAVKSAISPDGKLGLTAGYDGKVIQWNLADGKQLNSLNLASKKVSSLEISPDGSEFITGVAGGVCEVWDMKTFKKIRTLEGPTDGTQYFMQYSSDGKLILTSGSNEWMRVYNAQTGALLRAVPASGNNVRVVGTALHPNGKYFASGSRTGVLKLWDINSAKMIREYQSTPDEFWSLCFSPDGQYLFGAGSKQNSPPEAYRVHMWETETGKLIRKLDGPKSSLRTLMISKDKKHLIGTGGGWEFIIWDISSGKIVHSQRVSSSYGALSPDGTHILFTSYSGQVRYQKIPYLDQNK